MDDRLYNFLLLLRHLHYIMLKNDKFFFNENNDECIIQSRCIHQNNQRSLTWNISLTDDQDEVSEHFLMMHNEPTTVAEQFGPVILKIPAYIRKEADELFKDSELDPNGKFDMINFRVSWILPSSYQQYLKSIPPAVSMIFILVSS